MDCAFCAQARSSHASPELLSRITWPEFEAGEVLSRLEDAVKSGQFKRVCIQVTSTGGHVARSVELVRLIKGRCEVPVDVAVLPRDMSEVRALMDAGVDHIGFGLDAASESVFRRVKGPHWKRILKLIEETAAEYPGRVAVHIIVGLGETEREAVFAIERMHRLGAVVGLFAFTPLPGTRMASKQPPALDTYRRVQAARWLIVHGFAGADQCAYAPHGRITALYPPDWPNLLADGRAFMTSGCPDCNRPYYNERPSGPLYNYPYPPGPEEAIQALEETGLLRT